ncbi:hypothetical protein AB0M87_20000 [Streptomyces sp. NPDC051320]|uniref:hypothetical protein n=1 Tax=Streptomyces sp. NPDC051320 TaxID=3154644 RepID=UPI00342E13D9
MITRRTGSLTPEAGLPAARICTVTFIGISMIVALEADHFGGVLGIIVGLVAAVMGPMSIPMLLSLPPAFRRCDPRAALSSWAVGLLGYVLVKFVLHSTDQTLAIVTPLVTSLAVHIGVGLLSPEGNGTADAIVSAVSPGSDEVGERVTTPDKQPAASAATD